MYEKCASTFGVLVWDEFTSHNFRFHLRFPTLSPTLSLIREILSTQPSVRGEALSLYVVYIVFFRVSLFGGVFTGFLHIWSIPCMLFIGLGLFLLLLVSDKTF